ncbi:MAG: lamin tail domain-containing protein [Bacteroidota bacterium]
MKSSLFVFLALSSSLFSQNLRVYHIDVEQADATLFVSPSGKTLLVDSGKNGHGRRIQNVMQLAGVTKINYFVNTHYHEDHYGGIDDLVRAGVQVDSAYDRGDKDFIPPETKNGSAYKGYDTTIGFRAVHLQRGRTIPFDPNVSVTCISSGGTVLGENNPPQTGHDENDMSISLLIQSGAFRYFLGGDIEETTEQKIADRDLVTDVDAYQSDHHGSNTSSSADFMNDLKPSVIVISNGNNGKYEHPRQVTLDFYAAMSPKPIVFQTNKYLKGGAGGNVGDDFIGDPESSDEDGTVLLTVNTAAGNFTATYRNKSHTVAIKGGGTTPNVVIDRLVPDPVGNDTNLEEVTIRNKGTSSVAMVNWFLQDESGKVWSLASLGTVAGGQSATIRRNGMPMSLNNSGDEIILFDENRVEMDKFRYGVVGEGVVVSTGH